MAVASARAGGNAILPRASALSHIMLSERKEKLMENPTINWKERCKWIGAFALFAIVVSVAIALVAKDATVTSYFSAIATGCSIVLAVVAIVYSSLERLASRGQIGEMESLIRQASSIITEKAGLFEDKATTLREIADSFSSQLLTGETEPRGEETTDGGTRPTCPLRIADVSLSLLKVLYLFAKLHRGKRDLSIADVVRLSGADLTMKDASTFIANVSCVDSIVGVKYAFTRETDRMSVVEFPETIEEEVSEEVERRIKDESVPVQTAARLRAAMKQIDEECGTV